MYVSRRRNLRHGGGILLSVEAMNIDAVHPVGSLLFSMDAYYNPNNDDNMQNTIWQLIDAENVPIAATKVPIFVGMVTGEDKVYGSIDWENLPRHEIVSVGETNTTGTHAHSISLNTGEAGGHQHQIYHKGYYNCDSGTARKPASTGHIESDPQDTFGWSDWTGQHYHSISGNTISDGNHSHTVTTRAYEGGYYDEVEEEDHAEGKQVELQCVPQTLRCFIWKRIS